MTRQITKESQAQDVISAPTARVVDASYDGSISLVSGAIRSRAAQWEYERCFDGLKLVIVRSGELVCKISKRGRTEIVGPCVCVIWNEGEHEAGQYFVPGTSVEYTAITLSASAIERQLGAGLDRIRSLISRSDAEGPHLLVKATPRSVCSLCTQVSACPLKGISRGLYISGKALEIAALTLTSLEARTEGASKINLSTKDIEKLHSAKSLLEQRLRNPPSLAELGLATGLNTRKLNEGFRYVFGASVFEHLQKIRLEAAYRMLVDDEMSASSAAYQVGYSAPHFSVAFRARFGVSPKQLRHATVMADERMSPRRTHAPN